MSAVEHRHNEIGAEVLLAISQEVRKSLKWLLWNALARSQLDTMENTDCRRTFVCVGLYCRGDGGFGHCKF